jgi:hypothetical protein
MEDKTESRPTEDLNAGQTRIYYSRFYPTLNGKHIEVRRVTQTEPG